MKQHPPVKTPEFACGHDHVVLFYDDERFPAAALASHLWEGLAGGDGALVVATEAHASALRRELAALGAAIAALECSGRLLMLDADDTLSRFMVDGSPERDRFYAAVGTAVDGVVAAAPTGRCRAFGEMVCLLVDAGAAEAAIGLEGLWNELLAVRHCQLHCAYRLGQFAHHSMDDSFRRICDAHGTVVPAASADLSADPGRGLAGMQQQALALEADIAEQRRAEAALKRDRDRLEELVTARTEELRIAKEKAEGANEAKSAFLASVSHELRTPLNAVLGHAQLLQREPGLGPGATARLESILQSGQHLLALINDLLDLTKIEAGKMGLCPVALNPAVLLGTVANIVRVKAEEKNLAFDYRISPDLPAALLADDRRLRQVLLNLLVNAVKFTDRGKVSLLVTLGQANTSTARLRFDVVDTGVGIAREQWETIFQPFEQVGDATRRGAGTGLGLAISRQLVRLMGSELCVDSKPGKGSRFWFEISCPVVAAAVAGGPAFEPVVGYTGRPRRIVIADDVADNRAVLADLLEGLGFAVAQASNGRELLALVETCDPDLAIVDLAMPVMGGLEAIRQLRQHTALARLPIVVVSASANAADRHASMAAGADAFLMKPIDGDLLLQRVGELIGLSWRRADGVDKPREAPLVPPPREQIEALRELALVGNMRSIRDYACGLVEMDPRYRVFAGRLDRLASSYQSKAILALVEEQLASAGPAP